MRVTHWRKSSFSGEGGSNCVEVAFVPAGVAVRDSKNAAPGPMLTFDLRAWQRFIPR